MPRAGRVDHGVGSHNFGTSAVLIADLKRRGFAAFGLQLVEADTADIGHTAGGADVRGEGGLGGERFEVAFHQFRAGRILIGLGRIPARGCEQTLGRAVDVVFPRREQLNVAPLAHRMADGFAGFEHDRSKTSLQHMRGSGKAHRTGADDRDCLCLVHCILPSN